MSTVSSGFFLNTSDVKILDMSKLKATKISEASEGEYQSLVGAQERMLEEQYTKPADISKNPTYEEYATVKVNGKIVVEIDNHGWVKSSNALDDKIQNAIEDADKEAGVVSGPQLAQVRAEKIAALLGGDVEKSSTAMTQVQFNAVPQSQASVDYEAMKNDSMYEQLQKTKQARTNFLTQQIAQEGPQEEEVKTTSPDSVKDFLNYMSKTPEERYFEAFLKEMGLTPEQFAALPPEERTKIEEEIKEKIVKKMAVNAMKDKEDLS